MSVNRALVVQFRMVSGDGIMTHGDPTITLKPSMLVHVPVGVAHGMKAEGGELTLVDFAQPPVDPHQMEWIRWQLSHDARRSYD